MARDVRLLIRWSQVRILYALPNLEEPAIAGPFVFFGWLDRNIVAEHPVLRVVHPSRPCETFSSSPPQPPSRAALPMAAVPSFRAAPPSPKCAPRWGRRPLRSTR